MKRVGRLLLGERLEVPAAVLSDVVNDPDFPLLTRAGDPATFAN